LFRSLGLLLRFFPSGVFFPRVSPSVHLSWSPHGSSRNHFNVRSVFVFFFCGVLKFAFPRSSMFGPIKNLFQILGFAPAIPLCPTLSPPPPASSRAYGSPNVFSKVSSAHFSPRPRHLAWIPRLSLNVSLLTFDEPTIPPPLPLERRNGASYDH